MIRTAAALALFFTSGFAALVYQVVWQRLLVFFSGADVHSATVVVAAFMAGLGCGSFAGGQIADRVDRVRSLLLFALAELAVAAFGLFSRVLFYDLLYGHLGSSNTGPLVTALILFAALLWPTFFMGASLPLLARGLTRSVASAAPTIGWLYTANTAGAAVGAFIATWSLLPQVGLAGSLVAAASLNAMCAAAAVPLASVGQFHAEPAGAPNDRSSHESSHPGAVAPWAALFALSGFIGLSLELVWFRLLGVMLKSTSFTFGTLLAIYLLGLALGGAVGSVFASRVRRPGLGFLVLQAAAASYAALSLTWLGRGLDSLPLLSGLSAYFGEYDSVDLEAAFEYWRGLRPAAGAAGADVVRLYLYLPVLLIGPPTLMAGVSFPLLQRIVQTDLSQIGRRVGVLFTANVLGSTAGAFVTGLLLLDWLGTPGTLTFLFVVSLAFLLSGISQFLPGTGRRRLLAYAACGLVATLVAVNVPTGRTLWARLHGASVERVIHQEDGTGLSVLRGDRPDFRRTVVFVNGLGQSWVPYGGIHTALGALPAFIHERPQRAALIGLGSGDTLFAMAGRAELAQITCVEIIAPQLGTLRELARWSGYPGLRAILEDPRVRHLSGDGRRYLAGTPERFDIIQADALRPHSAYAGNLYSDAYFSLLRSRLAPGGLAVSWAPTARIVRTFVSVFPHVAQHGDVVLGSTEPIVIDVESFLRRLRDPHVTDYYTAAGVNIAELLAPYTAGWRLYGPTDRRDVADVNTDLHPRDEFNIAPLLPMPFF